MMLNKHEKKMYAIIIGACLMSVVLGLAAGYLLFGGQMFPSNAPPATQYRAAALDPGEILPGMVSSVMDVPADIPRSETAQPDDTLPPADIFTEATPAHQYILRIADGYIAVYYAEEAGGALKELTTVPVSALPQADMEVLSEGIRVYSEEGLARILQDYGS